MEEKTKNNVQKIRIKYSMTQEDLGKKIGASRQTIIAIEKGNYTPSVLLALKIATFFKMPLEEVFYL